MRLSICKYCTITSRKTTKMSFWDFYKLLPSRKYHHNNISLISSKICTGRVGLECAYVCYSQIRDRLSDLKGESVHLQQVWEERKSRLDQMLEFQLFLRDAKNIDAMSSAHEVCCL